MTPSTRSVAGPAGRTPDATLAHLAWTLAFDWRAFGRSLRAEPRSPRRTHRTSDLTSWRAGRAGDARYRDALVGVLDEERPDRAALVRVQRTLGLDGALRDGPAGCADRAYGWRPGLIDRVLRKIAADADEPAHPVARGVRLYLDLIHVHPFVDGNARAATVWLVWALGRGGWPLPDLEAVVRIPKPPGDPRVPALMAASVGA